MWLIRTLCYIFLLIVLSSCAWLSEDLEDDQGMMTERDFYEKIQESLSANNWSLAISNLQLLESQFPFGNYAEQGQLELIYAHYKTNATSCHKTQNRCADICQIYILKHLRNIFF